MDNKRKDLNDKKQPLNINIMETKEKVLTTMKEAGEPLNAGKIAELSGIDRKEDDKAMKQLKEEGAIVSPVRCKWEPAK
jgi:predicted Zn-ribbon and HTH transcriptional regulator